MFQEGWGGGRRRKVWESPWGFLKCPRGQSVSRRRVSRGPRGTAARVVIGPRVMEQGTGCHCPSAWPGEEESVLWYSQALSATNGRAVVVTGTPG